MTSQKLGRRGIAAAAVVWLAALVIWRALHQDAHAPLIAVGVALDLTLTAGLAAYLFSRQLRSALFVAALGLTLATIAVPPVRWLAALIEPLLIALTLARLPRLRRVYRERRRAGDEAHAALGDALAAAMGSRALGHAAATELTMLGLALSGWFRRSPPAGFFAHKKSPWLVVLSILLLLVAVESVATHVVLMHLSRVAALILSLLALYSTLWLIGDYHALRLYPTTIEGDTLRVRVGLRWSARIALASIAAPLAIERVEALPADCLRATVFGPPNLVLHARGVAAGPFGIQRPFSALGLKLDEPEQFLAAVARATGALSRCT